MTTSCGSLLAFIKNEWALAAPVAKTDISWGTYWFNARKMEYPQITISDLAAPVFERYRSGSVDLDFRTRPTYRLNVWNRVPVGAPGTQQNQNVDDMRREVARILKHGIDTDFGGSLGDLHFAIPRDFGTPLHELEIEPKFLRYEMTLVGTRDL